MTDRLRELFDDMLADEPPLRTDPDDAEAAGRRLRNRYRTLWTVAGAASADMLVSESASSPAFAISPPGPTPSAEALAATLHCPADVAPYTVDNRDGSVLPDPGRAAQAVVAAAVKIATGEKFLVNLSDRIETSDKSPGVPEVYLVFDVGTDRGYGSVNLQLIPDKTGTPAQRAESMLDRAGECVDVRRRDYPDGSVAVSYPYGPPAQEAEVTHVWYFARAGYNMNIGMFPQGWSASSDPNVAAPPSALPVLGHMPLDVGQVMDVADVVAHST